MSDDGYQCMYVVLTFSLGRCHIKKKVFFESGGLLAFVCVCLGVFCFLLVS